MAHLTRLEGLIVRGNRQAMPGRRHSPLALAPWAALCCAAALLAGAAEGLEANPASVEANHVAEVTLVSAKAYDNPFMDAQVDALVTPPDGPPLRVPAFWARGDLWRFRYASPIAGRHVWRTECSDDGNAGLHGVEGTLEVTPNRAGNALYRHGPIRVAADHRRFEHADGAPFVWLGDTWWKNLCKRMTWEGFQELTADRQRKGFSVVQIVCGPYPDEGAFEARWENEGGRPYDGPGFTRTNPDYFRFADRRIAHLVEAGLVPAIVGGWGRGDCDGMATAGVEGMKRHWRNLIAHYGAYPTVWIIGGESQGPLWTEVARYVREIDPYHRPVTMHPHSSGRDSVTDESVIDFDMLQTGHGGWPAAEGAIPKLAAAYARTPAMPVVIGEYCYEGHMQTAFQDVQRYVFWGAMLSGAAGVTYGAAGVWHASVEGDPGLANVYDWTTWREGMAYPGSTQLGLGRRLFDGFPWARLEPHSEWTEPGCFAAGVPGEVRLIYAPSRGVYNWSGPVVHGLESGVLYRARYFDPASGRVFDRGGVVSLGSPPAELDGELQPDLFGDDFEAAEGPEWRDYGTSTQRENGALVGGKGMLSVVGGIAEADVVAQVEARTDAEAGIVLRFAGPDHYLVALYTPLLHAIYVHDREGGEWGPPLGRADVPEIGPRARLTALACGPYAALVLTDGERTYRTPLVRVDNTQAGPAGLWLYQVGDRQEYDRFRLSRAALPELPSPMDGGALEPVWLGEWQAPAVPSPQDWVLVLERTGD